MFASSLNRNPSQQRITQQRITQHVSASNHHGVQEPPQATPTERKVREVCNNSDILDLLGEKDLSACRIDIDLMGLMDSSDLTVLSLLLDRKDLTLGAVSLNVSETVDRETFAAVLAQLEGHPELALDLHVNGSQKGPIAQPLREVLARSAFCLCKGGVGLRELLFRPLEKSRQPAAAHALDLGDMTLLDAFIKMELDSATVPLSRESAKDVLAVAKKAQDHALAIAILTLSPPAIT